jgi:general secretion pathway protein I
MIPDVAQRHAARDARRRSRRGMARPGRGFTLLEVLVAISILGLGLTAILSAQSGLLVSSLRTEKNSFAVGLVRCKMSEVELHMMREGFPLVDDSEAGPCCEDDFDASYRCSWVIERIELPEPANIDTVLGTGLGDALGGSGLGSSGLGSSGLGSSGPGGLGSLGAIASMGQTGGGALGGQADLGSVAQMLGGGAAMGGTQSLAPLLMSLVYPGLKPMLEASIRRVSVTARWKEGRIDRDLTITQFLTNPQQGGFDPLAAVGLEAASNAAMGATPGAGAAPPPAGRTP